LILVDTLFPLDGGRRREGKKKVKKEKKRKKRKERKKGKEKEKRIAAGEKSFPRTGPTLLAVKQFAAVRFN
jgi:hypothetical protein